MIAIVATSEEASVIEALLPDATVVIARRPQAELLGRLLSENVETTHHWRVNAVTADDFETLLGSLAHLRREEMVLPDAVAGPLRRMVRSRPPSPPPPVAMRRPTWRDELRAMFFLPPRRAQ